MWFRGYIAMNEKTREKKKRRKEKRKKVEEHVSWQMWAFHSTAPVLPRKRIYRRWVYFNKICKESTIFYEKDLILSWSHILYLESLFCNNCLAAIQKIKILFYFSFKGWFFFFRPLKNRVKLVFIPTSERARQPVQMGALFFIESPSRRFENQYADVHARVPTI